MGQSEKQLRFPGGLAKALTLSYDDAVEEDIRLIDIMTKHGLKGTFNINAGLYADENYVFPADRTWGRRMTRERAVRLYLESGMEPACHGYTHPHLERLPISQATYEILRDRIELEEQFGTLIRGGAYPYGTYSDETVEALKAAGIVYYRTVEYTEKFDLPTDWLRMPSTCHHKNPRVPELTEAFVNAAPQSHESPMLFYFWGHSYEFERDQNWEVIENFAAAVGNREDVWYATNIEIYDYVDAWKQLRFSVDNSTVENPTAKDLYFTRHEKLYCIPAGKSGKLSAFVVA